MDVAFDIEIADATDLEAPRLGITCAAAGWVDTVFGWAAMRHNGKHNPRMTPAEAQQFAGFLWECHTHGMRIVAWNGLGFDFRVLAGECMLPLWVNRCKEMALAHYDPAFQMFCELGFMCGLQAAAKGLGLSGKLEGVTGKEAPELWRGTLEEQNLVRQYVAQDVRTTAEVFDAIEKDGHLAWVTKAGTVSKRPWTPERMLSVQECLELPLPDTSRMKDPWTRDKFAGWVGKVENTEVAHVQVGDVEIPADAQVTKVLIADLPEWKEENAARLADIQPEEYQGQYPPHALYE